MLRTALITCSFAALIAVASPVRANAAVALATLQAASSNRMSRVLTREFHSRRTLYPCARIVWLCNNGIGLATQPFDH